MITRTPWQSVSLPKYSGLSADAKFDVVVIGGGITGLSAAYLLKMAGKRVCLLERGRLATGDTGCTTAHLTCVTDIRPAELVRKLGNASARRIWEGGAAAINTIERITTREGIDCEFQRVPGFLHAAWDGTRNESAELERDCDAVLRMGFDAAFLDSVPFVHKAGVRFPNQAKFHPLKYVAGLARAVSGRHSAIHEEAEVEEVQKSPLAVIANGHKVECQYVVIATHVPLMGKAGLVAATILQSKLASYSTYAVGAKIARGTVPEASFWDTSDPYYYLRIDRRNGHDYAIFGGEDHKTGQTGDETTHFARLEEQLERILPDAEVDCRWSAQVVETNDGVPYIGTIAERQFVATGFSGNGMTFGTLAGMMACDAVLERENPWRDVFDVNRTKLFGGTWDLIKENLDYPYYLVRDRLSRGEGTTTRAVKRGAGKVLLLNGQRVACSRDRDGELTAVSAVCTHLGCIVHWNAAEGTWDCPCHGSRFLASGEVLAGPAESPLLPVEVGRARKTAHSS